MAWRCVDRSGDEKSRRHIGSHTQEQLDGEQDVSTPAEWFSAGPRLMSLQFKHSRAHFAPLGLSRGQPTNKQKSDTVLGV